MSRRRFLRLTAMGSSVAVLAACGGGSDPVPEEEAAGPAAEPIAVPAQEAEAPAMEMMEASPTAVDPPGGVVMAGDVIDYTLESDEWPGMYGSVTFFMHHALHPMQAF